MMLINPDIQTWIVLVVDDEPDNVGVPDQILTFYGAKVYSAENGERALEIIETVTPTFILADLRMPVMDGWNLLKVLRANPTTADIPVIALTAHAMIGDRERILEAGFDGYISKPFSLKTFISDIQACLEGAV